MGIVQNNVKKITNKMINVEITNTGILIFDDIDGYTYLPIGFTKWSELE